MGSSGRGLRFMEKGPVLRLLVEPLLTFMPLQTCPLASCGASPGPEGSLLEKP